MTKWVTRIGIACLVITAIAGGVIVNNATEDRDKHVQVSLATEQRHQRILAWIVERNPQATIKDFADFPATLIQESQAAGIDFRLILALIDKESQFNPRAIGAAGEIGLMQILPNTGLLIAKGLGVDFEAPARNKSGHPLYSSLGTLGDPRLNVRFGITYLKGQVERFGMGPVALRAYNRNPDHAKQRRSWDRYAEDIGLRLVSLVHEFPR